MARADFKEKKERVKAEPVLVHFSLPCGGCGRRFSAPRTITSKAYRAAHREGWETMMDGSLRCPACLGKPLDIFPNSYVREHLRVIPGGKRG